MCSLCGENPVMYCSRPCQEQHWPVHSQECQGRQQQHEEERRRDVRFYIQQLALILRPVFATLFLSVLWVKLSHPTPDYYEVGYTLDQPRVSFGQTFGSTGSSNDLTSLWVALIILGQIVVATILFACAFKYGKAHYVYYLIGVVVTGALGYFGEQLGARLLELANVPLDWISFAFFLWNFTIVGLVVIFWQGPVVLRQIYLVVMSSMMAFNLSQLPSLVAWIMLVLLAVWDLIAVLCPYGPLRVMLEASQQNNQELPAALIYTVAIWMMAEPSRPREQVVAVLEPARTVPKEQAESFASALSSRDNLERIEERPLTQVDLDQVEEEEEEESGLKLGLGDFVFYSVLVGQASLFDWITTTASIVAVTSGLCLTIFLLVVYEKPLPALPISIAVGVLFYFVSSMTLKPMVDSFVTVREPTLGLFAGQSPSGFLYL
ncbi:Presenilin-domain-containing protein [Gorgonomyces haynaldii]|nr:Presenilin-domain-containing protein [Gorgonomyces haynaldii]